MRTPTIVVLLAVFGGLALSNSVSAASSKSRYWLFKPTPRDQMREMYLDRPDKTESPHTVDAGHFQMETGVLSYTYDKRNPDYSGNRVNGFAVGSSLLKVGLANFWDFHVGIDPYIHNRAFDLASDTTTVTDGFGDIALRMKFALMGNDAGKFALAAMPFVTIPTKKGDSTGADHYSAGLIVPYSVELPKNWGLAGQTQVNVVHNELTNGFHPEFINTIGLGYDMTERLGSYLEFYSLVSHEKGVPWVGTVDAGMTFSITDNIIVDAGINMGVTRSADDFNPFVGFSWRY
jgi:hypothetical protein